MTARVGMRVLRGPDWSGGDADGGEGHLGTVVALLDGHKARVLWDSGQEFTYRAGADGKFDLRVFDTAPVGELLSVVGEFSSAVSELSSAVVEFSSAVGEFLSAVVEFLSAGGELFDELSAVGKFLSAVGELSVVSCCLLSVCCLW